MNSSIEKYNDQSFLVLELARVNQKSQFFYLAKAPAKEIVKMFTVSPAEYDVGKYKHLSEKTKDESEYYEEIIRDKKNQIVKSNFQREKDINRVNQISKFISNNEYSFFPNTIICTCDLIDYDTDLTIGEVIENHYNEETNLSFYCTIGDKEYLVIPILPKSILVIDGQHRLEGLKKYFEDNPLLAESFDVILSFLIDFDRAIIAQQFYTINYEQKPVNKSVLYHLMGEFSDEIDELTLLHNFIRVFNELEKSPFYKRIKMLGKTPTSLDDEEKRLLSISQAFLIDELMKTISSKSINSLYQPIFLHYYKTDSKRVEIISFLLKYFNAVKRIRHDWVLPSESIVSKGLGIGALVKILQFLFPILLIEKFNYNADKLITINEDELVIYLAGLERANLKQFSGQGGAGSINKIKEELVENIEFFKATNYVSFENEFKTKYLLKFKTWNRRNL